MKLLISLILSSILLTSCNKDDVLFSETGIVGKWQLIENLADPGNGSGVFQPVFSDKTITFSSNGKYSSNGPTCNMDIRSGNESEGTWDLEDMILLPDDCQSSRYITYEFEGQYLILNYPCREACRQKYEKSE